MKVKERALRDWFEKHKTEIVSEVEAKRLEGQIFEPFQVIPWATLEMGEVSCSCGNKDREKTLAVYIDRETFIMICLACENYGAFETVWAGQARIIQNLRRRLGVQD